MACLACFCSESGMILMVKASDRSLVMENTALMALKATRTWGEVDGKSVMVSCHWKNKRFIWADSQNVTWLLIALEPDSERCYSHMKSVLSLVCETYKLTAQRRNEPITARDLKHQLKKNVALSQIIDFLILGFAAPLKETFLDVTGFHDASFLSPPSIRSALAQLSEDPGIFACFLLSDCKVVDGSKRWESMPCASKSALSLISQHTNTPFEINLDGVKKHLIKFPCRPTISLIVIISPEAELEVTQNGWKRFCRKNELALQVIEDEEALCGTEMFDCGVNGFLILHKESGRCWSSVRPKLCKTEDERAVLQTVQKLRSVFGKLQDTSSEASEYYEINPSYAAYSAEDDAYRSIVLFPAEFTASVLIKSGRKFLTLAIDKLNSSAAR